MNNELLLKKTLEQEIVVRKKKPSQDGARVLFFAGEEFNQELAQNPQIAPQNIIEFGLKEEEAIGKWSDDWIERKIRALVTNIENKKNVAEKNFPIIYFKNINKIKDKSLEESLLPVFDPQQNDKLFGEVDLSNYILLATSSNRDISQLSDPLISRLDCINVDTVQPRQFFLDKYYNWILACSIILILAFLMIIFWPNKKKNTKK